MDEKITFEPLHRFGVEIEVNSFDMRNRPHPTGQESLPEGIHYLGYLIQKNVEERVLITKWANNHDNNYWVVKPDSSCGMEVCSPVLKGWMGVKKIAKIVRVLDDDEMVISDNRCSFHVHVDVSNFSSTQINAIFSWWIKCEAVFMDAMSSSRKVNQYCRLIAHTDVIKDVSTLLSTNDLIERLGTSKYYSLNSFHLYNNKRKTVEFRIMDNQCCKDPEMAFNWTALILLFVNKVVNLGLPEAYTKNKPLTGYCWLDPLDVFGILGFLRKEDQLLETNLLGVRNWFLSALSKNVNNSKLGVFSKIARSKSMDQIKQLQTNI